MKTFTIDGENSITVYASKKAAKETGANVFGTEEEFAELIGSDGKRLVEIWNSLPGVTPVKKFKDSKTGVARIWKAIQSPGESGPAEPETRGVQPEPEAAAEAEVAKEAPVPSTPFDDAPSQEPVATEPPILSSAEVAAAEASVEPTSAEPVAEMSAHAGDVAPAEPQASEKTTRAKRTPKASQKSSRANGDGPRGGSKTAQVVEMLRRENGATLAEIMAKFGWQKHTVRGFMAGAMKNAGYAVESFKPEGGERTYRISK